MVNLQYLLALFKFSQIISDVTTIPRLDLMLRFKLVMCEGHRSYLAGRLVCLPLMKIVLRGAF